MLDLREEFKNWLIEQGYKEKTKSGLPSTIHDYLQTLDRLYWHETHMNYETLVGSVFSILPNYQGKTKTALHKYNAFLFEMNLSSVLEQERKKDLLTQIPKLDQDLYTTEQTADILHVDVRTMKRWRKNRIDDNITNRKKEYFNKKNPIGPKFMKVGGRYYYRKKDLQEYLGIS